MKPPRRHLVKAESTQVVVMTYLKSFPDVRLVVYQFRL